MDFGINTLTTSKKFLYYPTIYLSFLSHVSDMVGMKSYRIEILYRSRSQVRKHIFCYEDFRFRQQKNEVKTNGDFSSKHLVYSIKTLCFYWIFFPLQSTQHFLQLCLFIYLLRLKFLQRSFFKSLWYVCRDLT